MIFLHDQTLSSIDFTGFEQITGENVDFNTITISGDDVYQECEYRLYILYNKISSTVVELAN